MAKQGMKRPEVTHPGREAAKVPQIQGKAKSGKIPANPIVAGTDGPEQKVYHTRPITGAWGPYDTDLARDNLENDIPQADL